MSSSKSITSDIPRRIIDLSALFSTDKAFLKKCEINNHSFLTDLKKGRNENPGPDYLSKIVRGTGCSGTWLLTGEGEMFGNANEGIAAEDGVRYNAANINQILGAIAAVEKAESLATDLEGINIPEDFELQLAQLLVKLLEKRSRKQ